MNVDYTLGYVKFKRPIFPMITFKVSTLLSNLKNECRLHQLNYRHAAFLTVTVIN